MKNEMTIIKSPFRLSLFGGSSDYKEFYEKHGSLIIGTTINKYNYICIRARPNIMAKKSVITYSKLEEVNKRLSELPNSNQFPEYKPHITIAYVKKGLGKKYADPNYKYQIKNISKIVYVRPDKSEYNIQL